jgi:hypothetical protein
MLERIVQAKPFEAMVNVCTEPDGLVLPPLVEDLHDAPSFNAFFSDCCTLMVKIIRQGTAADLEHAVKAGAAKMVTLAADDHLAYYDGKRKSLAFCRPITPRFWESIDVLYLGEALNPVVDDPDLRSAMDVLKVVHGPYKGRLPRYNGGGSFSRTP